jgi:hypothetical protein
MLAVRIESPATQLIHKDLKKSKRIVNTVNYLIQKFGKGSFVIKDHWEGDLNAIGLADNDGKYLIYFSVYEDNSNNFHVSLEKETAGAFFPYDQAGDFDKVDLNELERLFVMHLRIKTSKPA